MTQSCGSDRREGGRGRNQGKGRLGKGRDGMGGEGRGGEEGGGEGRRGEVRTCREEKRGGEGRGGGNGGWWWEQRRIWDTEVYLDTITKDNKRRCFFAQLAFREAL